MLLRAPRAPFGLETGTYGQLRVRAVVTAKIFYIQKSTERAHFVFWPARTNMEGGGSGRYSYIRMLAVAASNPAVHVRFFCWLLVLWGASRSARKKASCARPQWRKLRVWRLAAGRFFSRLFSMRVLRFMMLGDCWGQKHGFRPRFRCLFWHHRRSQQTHSHASSKRDLHANSA